MPPEAYSHIPSIILAIATLIGVVISQFKLNHIAQVTNSTLSAAKLALDTANIRISQLEGMVQVLLEDRTEKTQKIDKVINKVVSSPVSDIAAAANTIQEAAQEIDSTAGDIKEHIKE